METYKHSVFLDTNKCSGCTTCVRHCPTEAIRVKDKRAVINSQRCIDCGECIRVCPSKAKKPLYDKFSDLDKFKWKIALPAPSLYGQFDNLDDIDYLLTGLKNIGFDDVYEVATAAELVSAYTRMYLKTNGIIKPVISSACPVIVRLIGLRFPSLKDNIMPMLPPMEIAAIAAREKAMKEHPEFKTEDIGICFISPCPAKVSFVKNSFGGYESKVDAVIAISDLYFQLVNVMDRELPTTFNSETGKIGLGWATTGGEASAIFNDKYLAADGIENVIHVLDLMENGNMPHLEFMELNACHGGCVGGVMTVENPYVAKARLHNLRRYLAVSQTHLPDEDYVPEHFFHDFAPDYQPITRLSDNIGESMRMMRAIQKLCGVLPGIDCGACGAPTCHALAEDVIKGTASTADCPLLGLIPTENND